MSLALSLLKKYPRKKEYESEMMNSYSEVLAQMKPSESGIVAMEE
jgi:hypothetical protein